MLHRTLRVSFTFAVLFGVAPLAHGATLYVSNRGVDGSSCGTPADRCRSITRAIANAAPGDTVMVGPGLYGELNYNGVPGETGEELGSPGCGCMLSINKPVIVLSSDGAAATVIDASSIDVNTNVLIITDGGEFGRPNHGFTVTQTRTKNRDGIAIDGTNIKVRGNQVVIVPTFGGSYGRDGISTVFNDLQTILIESNQVIGWGRGIVGLGAGKTISKNHVSANDSCGIDVNGGAGDTGPGGNISIVGNVATSNLGGGICVAGAVSVIGNAVNGNRADGIYVLASFRGTIERNNIFGNQLSGLGDPNCGVANNGVPDLVATNNYWGAAIGPGSNPADRVCNFDGGTTTTTPFATRPFPVNPEFEP